MLEELPSRTLIIIYGYMTMARACKTNTWVSKII